MTKAEIVKNIAQKTGLDRGTVMDCVEEFMEEVRNSVANGEPVYLRGFGSFIIKTRAEKTARNISADKSIIIPAHNIPAFKPAKEFMKQVSGDVATREK